MTRKSHLSLRSDITICEMCRTSRVPKHAGTRKPASPLTTAATALDTRDATCAIVRSAATQRPASSPIGKAAHTGIPRAQPHGTGASLGARPAANQASFFESQARPGCKPAAHARFAAHAHDSNVAASLRATCVTCTAGRTAPGHSRQAATAREARAARMALLHTASRARLRACRATSGAEPVSPAATGCSPGTRAVCPGAARPPRSLRPATAPRATARPACATSRCHFIAPLSYTCSRQNCHKTCTAHTPDFLYGMTLPRERGNGSR